MTVNMKRLALSLGLVGAIVVPAWQGSLTGIISNVRKPYYEDDRSRFLEAHGEAPDFYSEFFGKLSPYNRKWFSPSEELEYQKSIDIWNQSESIPQTNRVRGFPWLPRFIRDVLAGLFLTPLCVLALSAIPKFVMAYIRWVMG